MADLLTEVGLGGSPAKQHIAALLFRNDPSMDALFTFERRSGAPFSENKYFSYAALPTDAHMGVLEKIERLLA
jgi:hypothetical protein